MGVSSCVIWDLCRVRLLKGRGFFICLIRGCGYSEISGRVGQRGLGFFQYHESYVYVFS